MTLPFEGEQFSYGTDGLLTVFGWGSYYNASPITRPENGEEYRRDSNLVSPRIDNLVCSSLAGHNGPPHRLIVSAEITANMHYFGAINASNLAHATEGQTADGTPYVDVPLLEAGEIPMTKEWRDLGLASIRIVESPKHSVEIERIEAL